MPRCANVLLPVVAVPARYAVPMLIVIVIDEALLLKMLTMSPVANVELGTVIVPEADTHLPTSAVVNVVFDEDGTVDGP